MVGTETQDDAGIYRLTDEIALVQTIDFFPPVVDDPFVYGQIAAANALSDVYAMGGVPKTAMNLVGFPDNDLPLTLLGTILQGGSDRLAAADCALMGGHTVRDAEIKFGLSVTGVVHPKKVWTNANAQPGDKLLLAKPLGTGFITTAAKRQKCPDALLQAAITSMVQLNRQAAEVLRQFHPNAVTDVTGFGLAGHGLEMALGSKVTLRFSLKQLPIFPGVLELVKQGYFTRASKSNRAYVAEQLNLANGADKLLQEVFFDAQTSGGLFISIPAAETDAAVKALQEAGYPHTSIIGEVLPLQKQALIVE